MKLIYFPALLFAALLIFVSCEYEDYEYQTTEQTLARIKTESSFRDDQLARYNIFEYDEYGRIIRNSYVDGMGGSYTTEMTTYSDDLVITHEYYSQDESPYVYLDYLNRNGLVDSTIVSSDNKIEYRIDYKYDREAYLTERILRSDEYGMFFTMTNKIMNGNVTRSIFHSVYDFPDTAQQMSDIQLRIISSRVFKSEVAKEKMQKRFRLPDSKIISTRREYTDTIYFEYSNKLNTISDACRGMAWEGMPNRNLVEIETYSNGEIEESQSYGYEFDNKGRVTKQYYVENQSEYTLFTNIFIKIVPTVFL